MAFGVTCPTCGKAFSITDEIYQRKVSGRVVTIKCKQCQGGIRVDATKPGVTKISAATKEAVPDKAIETKSVGPLPPQAVAPAVAPAPRVRQATLIGGVANSLGKQAQAAAAAMAQPAPVPSAPPPPAPPPPPPAETLWAVEVGDGQDREMPLSDLGREIERGAIAITALAWREGMPEWLEVRQIPELAGFVKKATEPKPSAFAAGLRPAIRASAPRAPEPPASEEVPTQPKPPAPLPSPPAPRAAVPAAPKAPPAPPRASAPEAAPPPRAPAPPPPAPPPPAPAPPAPAAPAPPAFMEPAPAPAPAAPPPPAPFQLAPSAIAASPAPPLAAPAAPAPAPVVRPPVQTFATPGPVAASTDFELPQVRSKAPLVIAGVAVIGAVIAAVVVLKGGEQTPVPLAAVTASPAAVTPSPTTPSTPTTAATSTATAAGTGDTPSDATPQTTPGAGFAELFATGARDAEGSGAVASRFDPAVAKKAVAKVLAGGVGKCKEPGGPRGVATAVIAFESSGKVSTVTFSDPPFAGTSTANCLTSMLKQASIPPFKGLPGTLSQPISVR